jgi:glycosyltransferase involved in cell wall biosynthesis
MNNTREKKEIIFIQGNLYPYDIGGHEVFNYYLYQEFKNNYDVKIFSHYKKPTEVSENHYFQVTSFKPLALFFPLLTFFKLIKERKSKTTLVLTYSRSHWLNWWPYPILNKLFNLKYIIIIHGGGLTKWKWKLPLLKLFKRATLVIGISKRICLEYNERTGVYIKRMLPLIPFEKSSLKREGIREKYGIKNDENVFLIVGSIKPLKNPSTIISAAKYLGINFLIYHKIKFLFAGDGILLPQIKSQVVNSKLENHFNFLGNVSREIIPEIYALSDVYIISSDFEGTPLSLLEAMHNKLSIIAANSPGINDVITHDFNGLLFKTKDSKELANSIIKSLNRNELLIDNASQTIKKYFNHQEMIEEYKLIFNKR